MPESHSPPPPPRPPEHDSLRDVAAAAAAGDEGAFNTLHKRLGGGLLRLFTERSRGRGDLADDFSQRTWAQVWQALIAGKYDPQRAAISTFVYAVGYRVWLQHMRATGRAEARDQGFAARGEGVEPDDPAAEARLAESIETVRRCLQADGEGRGGLSEEERWILRSTATGMTDREVARRLKVSASTANGRKQAALDKLRAALERPGASILHRPSHPNPPTPTGPNPPRISGERGGSGGG